MSKITVILVVCLFALSVLVLGVFMFNQADSVILGDVRAEAVPDSPGTALAYLQIKNGDTPDQLLAASSAEADEVIFLGARGNGNLPIPANGIAILSSDGVHLMLTGLDGNLEEGRLIPIALEFARSGIVTTRAQVKPPNDPHSRHAVLAPEIGEVAPSLEMKVMQGDNSSWKVELITMNFIFDPDQETPVHIPGHGHGHLYINGVKIQRMYSETATIGSLPPGKYEILVVLNTNVHVPYMTKSGEPVAASEMISVELR